MLKRGIGAQCMNFCSYQCRSSGKLASTEDDVGRRTAQGRVCSRPRYLLVLISGQAASRRGHEPTKLRVVSIKRPGHEHAVPATLMPTNSM